ncbi:hypothetical protein QQ008_28360, partial [Fulvivirgaceae bacterium BMA10]|nr:hypothetical protein [Fulvivirgaceae bacterium BMA10]
MYIKQRLFIFWCLVLILGGTNFNALAQCTISGLNSSYCTSESSVGLGISPGGGILSGPGISGTTFDPSVAGVGSHNITYFVYDVVNNTGSYAPSTFGTPTTVALGDDAGTGAIGLGFNFDFFQTTYSNIHIASNGYLTFTNNALNVLNPQTLPDGTNPDNLIAFAWNDIDPTGGGTIRYETLGTSPNRIFVVEFLNVPHFGGGGTVTAQVKLFETTNVIEIHTTNVGNNGNQKTMGIENVDGSVAFPVAGRNDTNWFLGSQDFVSFTPCSVTEPVEVITTPNIGLTVSATTNPICNGASTNVTVASSENGVPYQLRTLADVDVGSPVNGDGGTINLPTGALAATTGFKVVAKPGTTCEAELTQTVNITVDAIPATPTITVTGGSLTFCEDGGTTDVDLQSSAAPNGGTYLWYKDGIATALTTQTITLNSVAESGDYTVAVTDGAGANCTSAQSAASTVTINPRPSVKTVTIVTDPICDGDVAQVQITSSDAGINYEVFDQTLTSVSASTPGTGANLTITTSALSTAVTSLIVRATNPGTTCTRDFAGVGITIDAIPATPTITVTGGSLTFCEDGGTTDVDLQSSAAPNGGTYLWYKDGIATALTTQTITLNSVAESGDYTVEVTDGAGANCTSAQSAASTVTINPRPAVKTVTILTDPICDGDVAQVQITASDAGINYEVFDQALTSVSASTPGTGANLTITTSALSTSVTSLIVRATNPGTTCTRDFAGVGITIDAIPATPTITVTGGSLTFCEDGGTTDVDLQSSAAPNGGTYLWYKDGIATALTTQTITLNSVAESGDYTVEVTDGAGANCTSAQSAASTVTINPRPAVKTVTILTDPICDGDVA